MSTSVLQVDTLMSANMHADAEKKGLDLTDLLQNKQDDHIACPVLIFISCQNTQNFFLQVILLHKRPELKLFYVRIRTRSYRLYCRLSFGLIQQQGPREREREHGREQRTNGREHERSSEEQGTTTIRNGTFTKGSIRGRGRQDLDRNGGQKFRQHLSMYLTYWKKSRRKHYANSLKFLEIYYRCSYLREGINWATFMPLSGSGMFKINRKKEWLGSVKWVKVGNFIKKMKRMKANRWLGSVKWLGNICDG